MSARTLDPQPGETDLSQQSDQAWARFDQITARGHRQSPWIGEYPSRRYVCDLDLLKQVLAVPIELNLGVRTGIPAKAVDVWVAQELRRSGFDAAAIWPRPSWPRVLPIEISTLLDQLPNKLSQDVRTRLEGGFISGNAASTDAHVLGKAYSKQVDVVMARWSRGAELLVSTKRMDSSIGRNALNRIEESYGDAKNLKGRHPLAAIGFLFVIKASAIVNERATAERLIGLLESLAKEEDGYDATGLIVVDWSVNTDGKATVSFHEDEVPEALGINHFMEKMVKTVLDRMPIDTHVGARELLLDRHLSVDDSPENA